MNDSAGANHRPQLDALRCFAVFGVLITHFWDGTPFPWILAGVDLGFLGVRLFFVLSGFLITRILLESRAAAEASATSQFHALRQFYARRFLRIFPIYYLIVFAAIAIDLPPAREVGPWLLTYTSNFYEAFSQESTRSFGHFWTLAVEEQFYMAWPWLMLFAPRRWLWAITLAAVALAPLYRDLVFFRHVGMSGWDQLPFASLDTLGVGALLAMMFHHPAASPGELFHTTRRMLLPLGLGAYLALHAFAFATGGTRALYAFQEMAYAMICCWLIIGAERGFSGIGGRMLDLRPIVYLGRISYGIYAYHMFVPWMLQKGMRWFGGGAIPERGPAKFVLATAVTVLLAMASWHFFEGPINRLKRYFPYRNRAKMPELSLVPAPQ